MHNVQNWVELSGKIEQESGVNFEQQKHTAKVESRIENFTRKTQWSSGGWGRSGGLEGYSMSYSKNEHHILC